MRIYEARPEQAHDIASFMKKFEDETAFVEVDVEYTASRYEELMASGLATLFVLEDDSGKMIGGLGCLKVPDLHCGKIFAIETYWFVDREHRGVGIVLLNHFEEWAKKNGCAKIAMIHLADSSPEKLEELYRLRGYELIEKHYVKEV